MKSCKFRKTIIYTKSHSIFMESTCINPTNLSKAKEFMTPYESYNKYLKINNPLVCIDCLIGEEVI